MCAYARKRAPVRKTSKPKAARKGRGIKSSSGAAFLDRAEQLLRHAGRTIPQAPITVATGLRRGRGGRFAYDPSREGREDGVINTGEVSFLKRSMGRPMKHNLHNAWKELQATTTEAFYRYQGASPFSSATGFYNFDRSVSGTIPNAGSLQNMPLYLLELTPVPFNGQMTNVYTPFYQLQAQYDGTSVSTYGWRSTALSDQTPAGVSAAGPNWEVEASAKGLSSNNASTHPGAMDILSYADIRMICVGATTTPTKFEISLVQFTQDWLHPGVDVSNTINAQGKWDAHADRVWESEVWPYITSPIMPTPPKSGERFIKKLHSVSFTLQAKTSIETSNEGHFKIVKLFKWLNRRQRYDWNRWLMNTVPTSVGTVPMSYPVDNNDTLLGANAILSQTVTPRARIYLMVKATNQTPGAAAVTTTPSFDLVVRKKHVMNG